MTRVIIDGDACPVTDSVIRLTEGQAFCCIGAELFTFSMQDYPSHVEIKYVDDGPDSVDYKIVQLAKSSDIVVTQDYGLASLLLGKVRVVMHHNGMVYTEDNIGRLLEQRYRHAQARQQGERHKGPKRFTEEARTKFELRFQRVIDEVTS